MIKGSTVETYSWNMEYIYCKNDRTFSLEQQNKEFLEKTH